MKFRALIMNLAAAVLLSAMPALAGDVYEIDQAHSTIGFAVKHLTVSTVRGHFNNFKGTINHDPKDITKSSVEITIEATSVDTGNAKRDEHLRNKDFFEVAKYPQLTFKSKKIIKRGEQLVAVGPLNMHGVSKEIEIPFTLSGPVEAFEAMHIGAEGRLTVNRQDWGMKWGGTLNSGGLLVGNDVQIELLVEAGKKMAPAAAPATAPAAAPTAAPAKK